MEPFTITCATCQSLIRVRNPKMIGQIANCPKCNSMIQIAESRQIRVESHRGVIDSNAMTKESFAPVLEDEYRLAPSDVPSNLPNEVPGDVQPHSDQPLLAPPRAETGSMFEATFEPSSFAGPPLPDRKSASAPAALASNAIQHMSLERSARNRHVLLVAVLGSSGALLAGLLFTGFLWWYRSDQAKTPVAQQPPLVNEKSAGPKFERAAAIEPATNSLANPLESATDSSSQDIEDLGNQTTVPIDIAAKGETPEVNGESNSEMAAAAAPSSAEVKTDSVAKAEEQAAAPVDEPVRAGIELPEQLKKFESILNTVIEPQLVPDEALQKAPPTAEDLGLSLGADSRAVPVVDVASQLQLELFGLILPAQSTSADALNTWALVSGIPTAVNLDTFAAAGVDPYKLMTLKITASASLAQIGAEIADQLGVELKVENQYVAYEASEAAMREKLPLTLKITDLVGDAEQQQWLLNTLKQFSPQHGNQWQIKDGELTVDHAAVDLFTWFWAVRMLESWRHAAGLETQLSKLEQAKFVTKFVDPDKLAALDQPLDIALLQRAPIAQLFIELGAAANMHTWIDWPSVGQRGMGTSTLEMMVTQQRTLRQCLRDVVDKYGVVVACEDERSLWITSAASYRAQPRIYVLPSQGKTAEQWMEELQPLTPATAEAVQPVQAILTPDKHFVVVRCCRPRVRTQ